MTDEAMKLSGMVPDHLKVRQSGSCSIRSR